MDKLLSGAVLVAAFFLYGDADQAKKKLLVFNL